MNIENDSQGLFQIATPSDRKGPPGFEYWKHWRMRMLKKIMLAAFAMGFALTSTACNTVRGAGEDLQSAADAVDEET